MKRKRRRNFPRWIKIACLLITGPVLLGLAWGAFEFFRVKNHYEKLVQEYDLDEITELDSGSIIYDRDGQIMGRIFIENREPISLDQIPLPVVQAVVAAEDARFYRHDGVDYYGLVRAALRNYQAGRIREGGSTITQQLARNTFDMRERTYERKMLEIFMARRIEKSYSKNEILELYLNRIYFGFGLHGIEAAARGYFGKPASELNLSEAAMLAGLIRSPNKISPWASHRQAVMNRNLVLERMYDLGMINRQVFRETRDSDLTIRARRPLSGDSYAIDYVRQQAIAELGFEGATRGGYQIHTTLDSRLLEVATESLKSQLDQVERLPDYDHQTYSDYQKIHDEFRQTARDDEDAQPPAPTYLQGAVLAIDNNSGGVLVLVGGRDFHHSKFNRTLQGRRPPGTAFKPFVYAAAYERDFFPGALVEDTPIDNRRVMIGGTTGILGEWGPERGDNRYEGAIPLRQALITSKNAATVRLGMRAGLQNVIDHARAAGFEGPLRPFPATFLGASEATLQEMVGAYSIFPRQGSRPDSLFIIDRIENAEGEIVYQPTQESRPVISPTTAYQVHSALEESLEWGSASKAYSDYGLRRFPAGGKTGTAYNFTDLWFLGYDSAITCGVWVGFDRPSSIFRGAFSSDIALPIWVDVMNASAALYPPAEFDMPPGLERVEVCLETGLPAGERCYTTLRGADDEPVQRRTTYFELATAAQIPDLVCEGPGASLPTFAQRGFPLEEGEWPRAAPAMDLSLVRPVAVRAPSVVGFSDPYDAINPGAQDGRDIRIARAIPVNLDSSMEQEIDEPIFVDQPQEIRRAQPAGPLDSLPGETVLELPAPPPIDL